MSKKNLPIVIKKSPFIDSDKSVYFRLHDHIVVDESVFRFEVRDRLVA